MEGVGVNALLDRVTRFKERRNLETKPISLNVDSDIKNLLGYLFTFFEKIYSKGMEISAEESKGNDITILKRDDDDMKKRFNRLWDQLSREKQDNLVGKLSDFGLLSNTIKDALDMFEGKVMSLF